MTTQDHRYPLAPSWVSPVKLSPDGRLDVATPGELTQHTLLLEFGYEATHKRRQGCLRIDADGGVGSEQYFEANQRGRRFLNLTGLGELDRVRLQGIDCRWQEQARLLAFANPALADGPVLILSPHPDDAELAAFGLYSDHAERSWIVTLSAGEKLGRLDRQYIPGLDSDLPSASARKGMIRAWNSVTTPLLAGVSAARLFCLGYFNDSLARLVADPEARVAHGQLPALTPAPFRRWNPRPLPGDEQPGNQGALLLADLAALLTQIRPCTVLVTHPEVDPHGIMWPRPVPWPWRSGAAARCRPGCCSMPITCAGSMIFPMVPSMRAPRCRPGSRRPRRWGPGAATAIRCRWHARRRRWWPWRRCTTCTPRTGWRNGSSAGGGAPSDGMGIITMVCTAIFRPISRPMRCSAGWPAKTS